MQGSWSPSTASSRTSRMRDQKGRFSIQPDALRKMVQEKDMETLQALGGALGIAQQLHCNPGAGTSDNEATQRQRRTFYGTNVPVRRRWLWGCLGRHANFSAFILLSLIIIYVALSLALPDSVDDEDRWGYTKGAASLILLGCGWLSLMALDVLATFVTTNAYDRNCTKKVMVTRNDAQMELKSDQLLVGDLIHIHEGQSLAADCLVLSSRDMQVDEFRVTGESSAHTKDEHEDPFLINQTVVLQGFGTALVVAVGSDGVQRLSGVGPLQLQVARFASRLWKLAAAGAFLLFITLSVKQGVLMLLGQQPSSVLPFLGYSVLCTALALAILPSTLAWVISTAFCVQSMVRDHCAIRDQLTCELLAAINAVCCDQSLMLHKAAMAVAEGWIAGEKFVMADFHEGPSRDDVAVIRNGTQGFHVGTEATLKSVCESLAMNSIITCGDDPDHPMRYGSFDCLERALLRFLTTLGHDPVALQLASPAQDTRCFAFFSAKKRMTTVVKVENGFNVHVKGFSEAVFADCTRYLASDGQAYALTLQLRQEFMNFINLLACRGYHALLCAMVCDVPWEEMPAEEPANLHLTLTAILGIRTPICANVPNTVACCDMSGIVLRMTSADSIELSSALAQQCGLLGLQSRGVAMRGGDFRHVIRTRPQRLDDLLPYLRVLSRCSPTHRKALTGLLLEQGDTVAIAGSSIDDIPARLPGTIGIALQSANEAFSDQAGLVLQDDHFSSFLRGILWSRTLRENVQKALQFYGTAALTIFLFTFIGTSCFKTSHAPLSAVHLLWLYAVLNPIALIGLCLGAPSELSTRRPVRQGEPLFTTQMIFFLVCHTSIQLTLLLVLLFLGATWFQCQGCTTQVRDPNGNCILGTQHRTLLFNTYMWSQVFNLFNARILGGGLNPVSGISLNDLPLLTAISSLATCQAIIVQFAGEYLDLYRLTGLQWLGSIAFASAVLPMGCFVRLIPLIRKFGVSRTKRNSNHSFALATVTAPHPEVVLQTVCRELVLMRHERQSDREAMQMQLQLISQSLSPLRKDSANPKEWPDNDPTSSPNFDSSMAGGDIGGVTHELHCTRAYDQPNEPEIAISQPIDVPTSQSSSSVLNLWSLVQLPDEIPDSTTIPPRPPLPPQPPPASLMDRVAMSAAGSGAGSDELQCANFEHERGQYARTINSLEWEISLLGRELSILAAQREGPSYRPYGHLGSSPLSSLHGQRPYMLSTPTGRSLFPERDLTRGYGIPDIEPLHVPLQWPTSNISCLRTVGKYPTTLFEF